MSTRRVDVILPAGGRIKGRFAAEAGQEVKALIAVGGATVLERTLETLRATERVSRTIVVGPPEVLGHAAARRADAALPDVGSGAGNIFAGLAWLQERAEPPAERVLVLTTDLPFLTAEGVVALLDACPGEAGLILPVIQREEFEARFPGAWRRYVHLRDGDWIIGCACVMSPAAAAKAREHFERAFAHRKNVFALAWALGPSFLARLVLRRLTVDDIERRGGQMLACECRAVRGLPAELGFDIDRPVDYRYAMAHAEPASDAR